MTKIYIVTSIVMSLLMSPLTARAQDDYTPPPVEPIQKPYKFSDNLFYGANFGTNYSLSSYVIEQNPVVMLRPTVEGFLGKNFTQDIAARVNLGYQAQAASIGKSAMEGIGQYSPDETLYKKGPNYTIHMFNTSADAMYNLNRLLGQKRQDARFAVQLIAGGGMNTVFFYSDKTKEWADYIDLNRSVKFAPEFHAGARFTFNRDIKNSISLQFTWHQTVNDYTGLTAQGARHYLQLSVGFSKRVTNHYCSYQFENFRGNEKRYFQLSEENMLKAYAKLKKKNKHLDMAEHPQERADILSFPHTYAYLTPRQSEKLKQMVQKLKENPETGAVIAIYPHCTRNGDMTLEQGTDRCQEEINTIITELWGDDLPPVRYELHNNEYSPISPDGIWFHNAFITYENK